MIEQWLLIAGAAIFGLLGTAHLAYTFFTDNFDAFDGSVTDAMKSTSPRISKETTMWKAWIGFNASHSVGAMSFSLLYITLALKDFELVQSSLLLSAMPVAVSLVYLVLARLYWFIVPFSGILVATLCFAGSLILGGL